MVDLGVGSRRRRILWRWRHHGSIIVVVVASSFVFRHRSVWVRSIKGSLHPFSKLESEIGICIEIGILPEHSKLTIIFKINSWDSRNSDD